MSDERGPILARFLVTAFAAALLLGLAVGPAPDHPAARTVIARNAG